MRTAALVLFAFVAFSIATNAQRFSLLPQVGFENSKTTVNYNGLPSFAPEGVQFSPQASLRLDYASKLGHGFFIGAATSRSTISFSFTNPEQGMNDYISTVGNMQVRLEGGYQFNSKPIFFKGSNQSGKSATKTSSSKTSGSGTSGYRSGCCMRNWAGSNHCSGSKTKTANTKSSQSKNKGSWMRIQPSIGMAFIPWTNQDIISKTSNGQTAYEYRAGNWNTAFIAGTGFEFGKNKNRLFTVSINYFKGLGNLGTQTIESVSGTKAVTTTLKSDASGWNMRVGIPFSLGSKTSSKVKKEQKQGCQQYKSMYRCTQRI